MTFNDRLISAKKKYLLQERRRYCIVKFAGVTFSKYVTFDYDLTSAKEAAAQDIQQYCNFTSYSLIYGCDIPQVFDIHQKGSPRQMSY